MRELYLDIIQTICKIAFRLDAFELISFKHGMMIDKTELDSLVPIHMTLTVTHCHGHTR